MEYLQAIQTLTAFTFTIMQPLRIPDTTETILQNQFEICVQQNTTETLSIFEYEQMRIDCVPEHNIETEELSVGGWIADWDYRDGITTVKNNPKTVTRVSPFWYNLKPDGNLDKLLGYNVSDYKQLDIEITPTITSFNPDTLNSVLSDPQTLAAHVQFIVDEVIKNDVDGIDLDYESIYTDNKEQFFTLLQTLKQALQKHNKKLIFTAHPKWGDFVTYTGFLQTRNVQDYKRISDIVDELRIMAYEYTGRRSTQYGPNAPLAWLEDIIRYAISEGVPRHKLVLGLPSYSYDYLVSDPLSTINFYPKLIVPTDPNLNPPAYAYYNKIIDNLRTEGYKIYSDTFNHEWGESVLKYEYIDDTRREDRTIVYPNNQTVLLRKELAARFGIKGIYYWKLGDEGSLGL